MAGVIPPVNALHEVLRKLTIPDAIALIAAQIPTRGYAIVKGDPGVFAWVGENREELSKIARVGGLGGQAN